MNILAIDPGNQRSAWLVYDAVTGLPLHFGIDENHELRDSLANGDSPMCGAETAVIEMVSSYGMAVGREVFETVYWIGRFYEVLAYDARMNTNRMYRMEVKQHLCHDSRAKDSNIRQALLDRFGPGREKAIGTKKEPGALYGVSKDVWSALAIAVTFADIRLAAPTTNGAAT